ERMAASLSNSISQRVRFDDVTSHKGAFPRIPQNDKGACKPRNIAPLVLNGDCRRKLGIVVSKQAYATRSEGQDRALP
ncbi:MAG TPA: hypothetical protein VGI48_01490, partial [Caldimonas sp.]